MRQLKHKQSAATSGGSNGLYDKFNPRDDCLGEATYFLVIRGGSRKAIAKKRVPSARARIKM